MSREHHGAFPSDRSTTDLDVWTDLASRVSSCSMRTHALRSRYADGPLDGELDALIGELDAAFSAAMRAVDRPPAPPATDDAAPDRTDPGLAELASTITHELTTPLAVVKIAIETLLRLNGEDDAPERRRLLEVIRRHSELAVAMVRRLGVSGEIAEGRVMLTHAEVDLAELVTQAVEDLRAAVLGDHPVRVIAAQRPVIDADASAVLEIVFNLLTNAAKYSNVDAPIEVTTDLRAGVAQVVVRDHGAGVAPDRADLIFEQHRQLDESSRGTGLGLYISRGLARAHGGDLIFRPASTGGSEFALSLPLRVLAGSTANGNDRLPAWCNGGTSYQRTEQP